MVDLYYYHTFNVIKWNTRQKKIMPTSCIMHHTKSLDALANHDSMIVAPELSYKPKKTSND